MLRLQLSPAKKNPQYYQYKYKKTHRHSAAMRHLTAARQVELSSLPVKAVERWRWQWTEAVSPYWANKQEEPFHDNSYNVCNKQPNLYYLQQHKVQQKWAATQKRELAKTTNSLWLTTLYVDMHVCICIWVAFASVAAFAHYIY